MKQLAHWVLGLGLSFTFALGCSDDEGDSTVTPGGGAGGAANGGTAGTLLAGPGGTGGTNGTDTDGGRFPIGANGIPTGFARADIGAWKLGPRVPSGSSVGPGADAGSSSANCGSVLTAVVRDFKDGSKPGGHPDFQTFGGSGLKGIVQNTLGGDQKPVYAHSGATFVTLEDGGQQQHTTTPGNFRQWYTSNDSVNQTYTLFLFLALQSDGKYTFESNKFFPLDGAGFGDQGLNDEAKPPVLHNYLFTTEVHTQFRYKGHESFRFVGDDDLWVFINHKLAIDLGGMHEIQRQQVDLDTEAAKLGITPGGIYTLDLFHAERHTVASNFRIDTNLEFVNCGTVIIE